MSASERDWTTEEAIAHGRRRLMAGWKWAPGQVIFVVLDDGTALHGVVCAIYRGRPVHVAHYDGGSFSAIGEYVPDLRDPGTRGHALAQVIADVREAVRCAGRRRRVEIAIHRSRRPRQGAGIYILGPGSPKSVGGLTWDANSKTVTGPWLASEVRAWLRRVDLAARMAAL